MSEINKNEVIEPVFTEDTEGLSPDDALKNMRSALFPEEVEDTLEDEESTEEEIEEVEEEEIEDPDEEEIEEVEEESDDDEDDDFDDDDELNLDENPDEEVSDEEEEIEEVIEKETVVGQLKKQSIINKQLVADNDSLNEQLVSKDQKIEELSQELEKFSATRIDPTSHPDFMSLRSKAHNGIASQLRRQIGTSSTIELVGSEEQPRWGKILTDVAHLETLPFDQQDDVEDQIRLEIAQRLGFQGEELDPEYDNEFVEKADTVIRTMGNFTGQYEQLAELHKNIVSKSQTKSLEIGYKEYMEKTKVVNEGLATIETMSDKDLAEDPDSLQSLAARKIKRSPQMKSQFEKIKKAVIEMAYGPQALSQEELDKHAATGKDMVEFQKKREKRVESFRNQRLTEIASLMLLLPEIKEKIPEYFKQESNQEKLNAKKKVLRKGKSAPSKNKNKPQSEEDKSIDQHRANIAKSLGM